MEQKNTAINDVVDDEEEEEYEKKLTNGSSFYSYDEDNSKKRRDIRCVKLRKCLRFVSVGKYEMKLYHRG